MIPGLSVIWVIVFVLMLAIILDRLLFKPLLRVMDEREARVKSATELARESAQRAANATAEFDARTRAAQTEVYRQMDETRRAALERRQEMLDQTRRDIEASTEQARDRIAQQAEQARAQLDHDADQLAAAVAARVLDRKVS